MAAPPTYSTLTYNGSDQALVTAGTASTGSGIQYAIGTNSTTAPTSGYSAAIPEKKNAGTYYVWYKAAGNENWSDSDAACVTAEIKQKEITAITGIAVSNKTYDGTKDATIDTSASSIVYTGKEDGDTLTLVSATLEFADAAVGTNKTVTISDIVLGGTSIDNYKLASGYQTTASATIAARNVTVTASDQTVSTGEKIVNNIKMATLSGQGSGHKLSAITLTPSISTSSAGTGKITPSAAAIVDDEGTATTSNYTIEYVQGNLTVTDKAAATEPPKPISDLIYNGSAQALVSAGTPSGGTMQYAISDSEPQDSEWSETIPTGTNAGTYKVWYRVKGNNRDNSEAASVTATISKLGVRVRGITGVDKTYDGTTAASVTGTFDGAVQGDRVTLTGEGTFANANVGNAKKVTATQLTLEGSSANNYKIEGETGWETTANITARSVIITADNQTVKVNESINTGTYFVSLAGAVKGHTVSSVTLTDSGTGSATTTGVIIPSNAKITDGTTDVTSNYSITYVNGILTVKKKSSGGGSSSSSDDDDDDDNNSSSSSSSSGGGGGGSSSGGGTSGGINYDELKYKFTTAITTINAQRAANGSRGITQQVVVWDKGQSLPYDAMKTLQDNPYITLIFKCSYGGTDYTFTIPGSAVRADPLIPWYGPLYLLAYYGQYAVASPTGSGALPVPVVAAAPVDTATGTYTVVKGDTLFKIAKQFNTTIKKLVADNNIKNANLIYPGQVLKY